MDDEQILQRGGTEEDIIKYAESNGADLTKEDFMPNPTNNEEWREEYKKLIDECWNKYGEGCEIYSFDFFVDIESFIAAQIKAAEKRGKREGLEEAWDILRSGLSYEGIGDKIKLALKKLNQ